jgi:hypothetical protein
LDLIDRPRRPRQPRDQLISEPKERIVGAVQRLRDDRQAGQLRELIAHQAPDLLDADRDLSRARHGAKVMAGTGSCPTNSRGGRAAAIERDPADAWPDFVAWRVNYEQAAYAVTAEVRAVPPLWSGPRRRRIAPIPPIRPPLGRPPGESTSRPGGP